MAKWNYPICNNKSLTESMSMSSRPALWNWPHRRMALLFLHNVVRCTHHFSFTKIVKCVSSVWFRFRCLAKREKRGEKKAFYAFISNRWHTEPAHSRSIWIESWWLWRVAETSFSSPPPQKFRIFCTTIVQHEICTVRNTCSSTHTQLNHMELHCDGNKQLSPITNGRFISETFFFLFYYWY